VGHAAASSESLFGKLKDLGKLDSIKGFTSLVLAGAACVGKTDIDVVNKAMTHCHLKKIDQWTRDTIGKTIQSKRRAALKPLKIPEIIFNTDSSGREVVGLSIEDLEGKGA